MSYFKNFKNIDYDLNGDGIADTIVNLTNMVAVSKSLIDNAGFYSFVDVLDGERPEQFSHRLYQSTAYYWTFLLVNKSIQNIWNDWPMSSTQLQEYCEAKYNDTALLCENWLITRDIDGNIISTIETMADKFKVGDVVNGVLTGATGTIKEIHTNNGYILLSDITGEFNAAGEDIRRNAIPLKGIAEAIISASQIINGAYAPRYFIDDVTGAKTSKLAFGVSPYTNFDYENDANDANRNLKVIKPEMIAEVSDEFKREIAK